MLWDYIVGTYTYLFINFPKDSDDNLIRKKSHRLQIKHFFVVAFNSFCGFNQNSNKTFFIMLFLLLFAC